MQRLWRTMISVGLAVGLSLTASVVAMPHAVAFDQHAAAFGNGELRPESALPTQALAAETVRAQSSDSSSENDDDRGSPPVFQFVCALIGFAVVVYLVLRRMRTSEPASNQA